MGLQSAATRTRRSEEITSNYRRRARLGRNAAQTERQQVKPIRTDAGLARQISQTFRAPVRLANADEIKTGQPQKFSSRRQQITAEQAIAAGERIFGK